MATITISGNNYTSYATVADADTFLLVDAGYDTWNALSTDAKGKNLILASRLIDSQSYIDSCDTQAERLALDDFKIICILIAKAVVIDGNTEILGSTVPEQDIDTMKAGSVEINYFRDFTSFSLGRYVTRWTPTIYALLAKYLKSGSVGLGFSNGTGGTITISDYGVHF